MTIVEAAAALRRKELSCLDLTNRHLQVIEERNPQLNAFITVTADAARTRAKELDRELASGCDRGPLHGIPIAHKDLIYTRGVRTTSGSALFRDFVPDHNAPIVDQLDAKGAVMLGKTGLHELAYGITSENPHFGVIRNPHDTGRVPGGSSGGAGSALASGMVIAATGTDTGGSIRIPASFCGIVGLKPTFGLVNTDGVQPLSMSLDHVGPMTLTVNDAATMLTAMTDRMYSTPSDADLRGLRIGLPENFYFDGVAPEVVAAVRDAAERAKAFGAKILPVTVPDIDVLNAAARIILLAEAAAIHRPRLHRRELLGADVFALLQQGLLVSGPDYVNAQRVRHSIEVQFQDIFRTVDCFFAPATATVAPRIGEREMLLAGKVSDVRLATTRVVRGINMLGIPALALPCGKDSNGLPIGLQIAAPAFREDMLFRVGAALN